MKSPIVLACLALMACGSNTETDAANVADATPGAVTNEAVADVSAAEKAEADAVAAADAELDNLDNSIDDAAPANEASGNVAVVAY